MKWRKGQGALEYLFMIGGALILVAVAIKFMKPAADNSGTTIQNAANSVNQKVTDEINQAINT